MSLGGKCLSQPAEILAMQFACATLEIRDEADAVDATVR
jgi:hypothetical protein